MVPTGLAACVPVLFWLVSLFLGGQLRVLKYDRLVLLLHTRMTTVSYHPGQAEARRQSLMWLNMRIEVTDGSS